MSYVIRTRHFGTRCGIAQSFKVSTRNLPRLGLAFPSGLGKLVAIHAPGLPNVDDIISQHTLFPFFSAFLVDSQRQTMHTHFASEPSMGSWMSTGLMAAGLRWRLATCLDCVAGDYADLGYTFWRNGHLVPGLALCPYHLTPLYEHCSSCVIVAKRLRPQPLPSEKCLCGVPLKKIRAPRSAGRRAIEIEISSAVREILEGRLSGTITSEDVHQAIFERSEALVQSQSCVRTYLAHLVESRIGRETLIAYGMHSVSRRSAFTRVGRGGRLSGNPFHNIFLILCLFGSVANLVSAIKARGAATKYPKATTNGMPAMRARAARLRAIDSDKRGFEEMRSHHRSIVLARLEEFPELKRRQLRSSDNNTYTFMIWFDKEWIDVVFPSTRVHKKSATQMDIHARRNHAFDVSLSGHIYKRHAILSSQVRRTRLSHTQLVLGHPGESYSRKKLESMPRVSQALKDCIETDAQWNLAKVEMQSCSGNIAQPLSKDSSV